MTAVKNYPISLIFGLAALAVRTAVRTAVSAVVTYIPYNITGASSYVAALERTITYSTKVCILSIKGLHVLDLAHHVWLPCRRPTAVVQ
jgi:hypothetical protein